MFASHQQNSNSDCVACSYTPGGSDGNELLHTVGRHLSTNMSTYTRSKQGVWYGAMKLYGVSLAIDPFTFVFSVNFSKCG